MAEIRHIPLTAIKFDSATQVRAEINNEVVIEYAERMAAGEVFPEPDVFEEGEGAAYWIGDGWHRLLAAAKKGDVTFPCVVHPGGRLEALKFSLGANAKHGLPRTSADKRKAIGIALREFRDLSSREIARMCAVDHKTVERTREDQLAQSASSDQLGNSPVDNPRLGADGKLRRPRQSPPAPTASSSALVGNSTPFALTSESAAAPNIHPLAEVIADEATEALAQLKRDMSARKEELMRRHVRAVILRVAAKHLACVREVKAPKRKSYNAMTEAEFVEFYQSEPALAGLDFKQEDLDWRFWCKKNDVQPTRKRWLAWLGKAEKIIREKAASRGAKKKPSSNISDEPEGWRDVLRQIGAPRWDRGRLDDWCRGEWPDVPLGVREAVIKAL